MPSNGKWPLEWQSHRCAREGCTLTTDVCVLTWYEETWTHIHDGNSIPLGVATSNLASECLMRSYASVEIGFRGCIEIMIWLSHEFILFSLFNHHFCGIFPAASSFLSLSEARPHHDFSPNRKLATVHQPRQGSFALLAMHPWRSHGAAAFFRKRWAFVGLHMVIICYNNQCSMFPAMGGRQKKQVLVGEEKKSFTIGLLEPVQGGKWRNDPGFSEHIILFYWVQERGRERERERESEREREREREREKKKIYSGKTIDISQTFPNHIEIRPFRWFPPPPIPNWWGHDTLPWHSGNWWLVLVGKYNPIVTS